MLFLELLEESRDIDINQYSLILITKNILLLFLFFYYYLFFYYLFTELICSSYFNYYSTYSISTNSTSFHQMVDAKLSAEPITRLLTSHHL